MSDLAKCSKAEFSEQTLIFQAGLFSMVSHGNQQLQDSRLPYAMHPMRVDWLVRVHYRHYERSHGDAVIVPLTHLRCAALLHDVLEHCSNVNASELRANFGEEITALVVEVTSDAEQIGECGKTAYLVDKMTRLSPAALFLKMLDRIDNLADYSVVAHTARAKMYAEQTKAMLAALQTRTDCRWELIEGILASFAAIILSEVSPHHVVTPVEN